MLVSSKGGNTYNQELYFLVVTGAGGGGYTYKKKNLLLLSATHHPAAHYHQLIYNLIYNLITEEKEFSNLGLEFSKWAQVITSQFMGGIYLIWEFSSHKGLAAMCDTPP